MVPPVTVNRSCFYLNVEYLGMCVWVDDCASATKLIMTSSIRDRAKNICHCLYTECSPAFQGNDCICQPWQTICLHLGFHGRVKAVKARRSTEWSWVVALWSSKSVLAGSAVISGRWFNVVWHELLASRILNLGILITEQKWKKFKFRHTKTKACKDT